MRLIAVILAVLMMSPGVRAAGEPRVEVDEETARVIDEALRYLANQQQPDGGWRGMREHHQVGITGYVMMAFLTAGHLPEEGEHSATVARGVSFLLSCMRPDGYIAAPTGHNNMYGHGIATIVLAEVYGQTPSAEVRTKLSRAVELIVRTQNDEGGWRYQPQPLDADISVTVTQLAALRAARNAGLDVPQETIEMAIDYVRRCRHPSGGFTYRAGSGSPGVARTAAAIYSLQVCGLYDDPLVEAGAQYIVGRPDDGQWFTYGQFYAAPAFYMVGGETWEQWYATTNRRLMSQVRRRNGEAHWDGGLDRGGPSLDPVFHTAVYTSVLAVPYHYLPLYQR